MGSMVTHDTMSAYMICYHSYILTLFYVDDSLDGVDDPYLLSAEAKEKLLVTLLDRYVKELTGSSSLTQFSRKCYLLFSVMVCQMTVSIAVLDT